MNKVKVNGLFANITADKISIIWEIDGQVASATQNIYLKKYDETLKKYQDDKETYDKAMSDLEKLGVTLENIETKISSVSTELYVRDDIASFNPLGVKYEPVSIKLGKYLSKNVIVAPIVNISEYKNSRFNVGVEIDGLLYKVSSLILSSENEDDLDTVISLRYTNKQIEAQLKMLESNTLDAAIADKVKSIVENAIEVARQEKIKEIKDKFNIDINKIFAENEISETINLEIQAKYADGYQTYYLVGTVL